MRRSTRRMRLLVGAVVVAACAGASSPGAELARGAAPLGPGWGRVVAAGTVIAVDPSRRTLTFAVAGSGRQETNEGVGGWRDSVFTGTRTARLLALTLILDAGGHPMPLASVRPRVPVMVWGVARPDAAVLALAVEVASPQFGAAGAAAGTPSQTGIVVARSGSTLEMLSDTGGHHVVVMTAATTVWVGGRPGSATAVSPYDVLQIDGPVNSDGSLVATRIDVEFSAPDAAQVSGPIEQSIVGLGGVVVAGTMVSTSAATYVLHGAAPADLGRTPVGRAVTVYGAPVLDGARPVGLEARVVVVR